jgi:hypothetical protein
MLFAIARQLLKTRWVTVQHPCGVGDITVERISGFEAGPVATAAEYRRHLRLQNVAGDRVGAAQ